MENGRFFSSELGGIVEEVADAFGLAEYEFISGLLRESTDDDPDPEVDCVVRQIINSERAERGLAPRRK